RQRKRQIDIGGLSHRDTSVAVGRAEPGSIDANCVRSWAKKRNAIYAGSITGRATRFTSLLVGCRYGGIGLHRAARVRHRSGDVAGGDRLSGKTKWCDSTKGKC